MQTPKKSTTFGVRLDPRLRRKLEMAAKRAQRTPSDYVRLLIVKALRQSERAAS